MALPTVNVTSSGSQTINTLQNAGQNTMANSHPIVVASDQTAIPVSATSLPLPANAAQDGTDGTGITQPTGGAGIRGWLSGIYKFVSQLSFDGSGYLKVNVVTGGSSGGSPVIVNPTSTLTRPANATAYSVQNCLITNNVSTTSAPSMTVARVAAGNFFIRRLKLATNVTTGWDATTFTIRLWSAAPTYASAREDGVLYATAFSSGSANLLGIFNVALSQLSDGAVGFASPAIGSEAGIALVSGQIVYWDLQYTGSASITPVNGQTFTLTADDWQN